MSYNIDAKLEVREVKDHLIGIVKVNGTPFRFQIPLKPIREAIHGFFMRDPRYREVVQTARALVAYRRQHGQVGFGSLSSWFEKAWKKTKTALESVADKIKSLAHKVAHNKIVRGVAGVMTGGASEAAFGTMQALDAGAGAIRRAVTVVSAAHQGSSTAKHAIAKIKRAQLEGSPNANQAWDILRAANAYVMARMADQIRQGRYMTRYRALNRMMPQMTRGYVPSADVLLLAR